MKREQDLGAGRRYLRAVIGDSETTNEQLAVTVNQPLSRDDEPQNRNEDLAALTGKLQSIDGEIERKQLDDDLRNILDGLRIPVLILDNDLRIRRFTRSAEKPFNIMRADAGQLIQNLRPNLDLRDLQPIIARTIETLSPQDQEVRDRKGRYYSMNVRPYLTSQNKIDGVLIALVDIDTMKRSLKDAERTRDYAEAIVDTVREPLVVLDHSLRVMTANRSFYESFQISSDEVENRAIFGVGGAWDSPVLNDLLERILPKNERFQDFRLTHVFPRVGERTLFLNARRLVWEGEMSDLILLAMEDVTERESINAELSQNRARLRDLTASLLTAQEEEGRRIASELHDDLNQKVAMLIVAMEVLEKGPRRSAESIRGQLASLRNQTESISDDLRDTAHRMHPSVVDHLGLPAALRALCADFSKQEKLQVRFRQRNLSQSIPPDLALCLYRVAQEALRNVAKHSDGNHARVSLFIAGGRVLLSISNSGTGFDLVMVKAKRGLGIVSMEERVRLVVGTLTIRSRPLTGTRVVVEIALPEARS
ncbi:MAG: PAS domain-containing protein [Acidobacteriota bacterium]|nr:PAS domain-containing protein [Acidobacteriota bacterium]